MATSARVNVTHMMRWVTFVALLASEPSCGGDGGGIGTPLPSGLLPSSTYAARCAVPRTGIDPFTGRSYTDRQGSISLEKSWLRSWTDELYLWYREVPDPNPAAYPTPVAYFDVLKTQAKTASGKDKDEFHFWLATAEWQALSQSGVQAGYGASWAIISAVPPRQVVVAYTEPGSPAATANIARGAEVLAVDGVDVVNGSDVETINNGLFLADADETHTFLVRDLDGTERTVMMTAADVESVPVPLATPLAADSDVGYMLFNDHIVPSEAALVAAIAQLRDAGVSDLVLDLRYNGGGFLDIASELAFMIAGPSRTAGRTFELNVFNDKYTAVNPVTGRPLEPTPFHDTGRGFSTLAGAPLPFLDLGRVFVLTGPDTCSASEAVINGLRGADVQVVQIGSTTCGKPYGFYPQDNCGTTYFAIEFKGVNAKGFGEYADGFVPGGTGSAGVTGCQVPDDFTHELGDAAEARLAAALGYRATQTCPPATFPLTVEGTPRTLSAADGRLAKSFWHRNRIYR